MPIDKNRLAAEQFDAFQTSQAILAEAMMPIDTGSLTDAIAASKNVAKQMCEALRDRIARFEASLD